MEFRILGPLEVRDGHGPLELAAARRRSLLAVLLLNANEAVSGERLVDELWGERAPRKASKVVQGHVSALRKLLGAARIATRPAGYVIEVDDAELDLLAFTRLVARARGEPPRRAAETLAEALALWRGPALGDVELHGGAAVDAERLNELRLAVQVERIDAELELGREAQFVGELDALVVRFPFNERLRAQSMLALYRSGRQADALRVYQEGRRLLVDELGLEPGAELKDLERRILAQDATLASPAGRRPVAPSVSARPATTLAPSSLGLIDPESDTLAGQTRVGTAPRAIAVGGDAIWVASARDRTVTEVDAGDLGVRGTTPIGRNPSSLTAAPGRVWAVVEEQGASVVVHLDATYGEVVATRRLGRVVPPWGGPRIVGAVAAHGQWIWAGGSEGEVVRLDAASLRQLASVATEGGTRALAIADGAVWAVSGAAVVQRIDPLAAAVVERYTVASDAVAVAADAEAAWVACRVENVVTRIDRGTRSVTTIPVGRRPHGVALGFGSVWVANAGDGTVSRIDPRTREVVAAIDLGVSVEGIATGAGGVWVTGFAPLADSG
jgi:DNA-binding SARP family transcriptional activator/DNA-binding beta-propeller fold protein YncE